MKNLFSALMICTMLLCTSLVSYGSDGATTTKIENFSVSEQVIHTDISSVQIQAEMFYQNETVYSYDVDDPKDIYTTIYLTKFTKHSPLIIDMEGIFKPAFYKNPILKVQATPHITGNESNHVGKLKPVETIK